MIKLVGIAGSVRKASFNGMLLRAAAASVPAGCTLDEATIRGIPLYDGDVEAESGVPSEATALKERIAAADGLVLVTPEYNSSIPGVFKNAIDWLSRPPSDIGRVFGDRPVAIMGATPGMAGTRLAQTAWLPVLRTLGMRPWFGKQLYVGGAGKVFDAQGAIVDEKVKSLLADFMKGFTAFVEETTRGRAK
ncbi:MAG: NADPH-dependent FMN reductase [Polyangiales bacterium]